MGRVAMRRWVMVGLGLYWMVFFATVFLIYNTHSAGSGDYLAYFKGAVSLQNGTPLYTGITGSRPYIYPPLLALLLQPTVFADAYQTSANIWFMLNVPVLLATLWMLNRVMPTRRSRLLLWIAPPLFTPIFVNFFHGQVSVVLFACIVGAWMAHRHKRPLLAGVLIAFAAWIKVYPVLILGYFLWRRDWRVLLGAAAVTVFLVPVQIIGVGWENFRDFFTVVLGDLSSGGQLAISHSNHSLYGFAARLFAETPLVQHWVISPLLLSLTRWGGLLLLGGVTLWALLRHSSHLPEAHRFTLEYAAVLLLMLFATTSVTPSGLIFVYFVYVALAMTTPPHLRKTIRYISLFSFFGVTVHFLLVLNILEAEPDTQMAAWMLSSPFFAMLMLWATVIFLRARAPAAPPPAKPEW